MIIKNYNCVWKDKGCLKSKYIEINNKKNNFYTDYIENELINTVSKKKQYKKIKTYFCKNCKCTYNMPWFDSITSRQIYSTIYGQQNKGWNQILDFINRKNKKYHGNIYKNIISKLNVKKYAEYNRPLTGIYHELIFRDKSKFKYLKSFFNSIIELNKTKQVAGKTTKEILKIQKIYFKKLLEFTNLKNKFLIKNKIQNFLITDNSAVSWGENDNYKSINSRALSREFFDLKILDIDEAKKNHLKYDLFGFFLSLDHSSDPKKVLDLAFKQSKYVIIHSHINPKVTKQHFFSLTNQFPEYLKKKGIYVNNISELVFEKKSEKSQKEMYLLCTKFKKFKKKININATKN